MLHDIQNRVVAEANEVDQEIPVVKWFFEETDILITDDTTHLL